MLNSDETEAYQVIGKMAKNSISFLIEEGFLRSNPAGRHLQSLDFSGLTLTLKGLTLLEKTPDALTKGVDSSPFVKQLKRAVKEGAKESLSEIIKALFVSAARLGIDVVP